MLLKCIYCDPVALICWCVVCNDLNIKDGVPIGVIEISAEDVSMFLCIFYSQLVELR